MNYSEWRLRKERRSLNILRTINVVGLFIVGIIMILNYQKLIHIRETCVNLLGL